MQKLDAALRDRLFLERIRRALGHELVAREHAVTVRLHRESHEIFAESARLRRRARWLCSGKPLPRVV